MSETLNTNRDNAVVGEANGWEVLSEIVSSQPDEPKETEGSSDRNEVSDKNFLESKEALTARRRERLRDIIRKTIIEGAEKIDNQPDLHAVYDGDGISPQYEKDEVLHSEGFDNWADEFEKMLDGKPNDAREMTVQKSMSLLTPNESAHDSDKTEEMDNPYAAMSNEELIDLIFQDTINEISASDERDDRLNAMPGSEALNEKKPVNDELTPPEVTHNLETLGAEKKPGWLDSWEQKQGSL